MRYPGVLIMIVLVFMLQVVSEQPVVASTSQISALEIDRAVLHVFSTGRALQQIDAGYHSGALTWNEAKALYAEQSVIRSAYINGKVLHGREFAARRAAFMLRVAQGTYAQLAFNDTQRRPMARRVTWNW